jgi:DNA-binding IclR family transcriptional regulator
MTNIANKVESKSQRIATVERAADVLLLFSQCGEPDLGITEIAKNLGLSKAAVHRILASLRSRGFIDLIEESRRYTLGTSSLALGLTCLAQLDIRSLAAPELALLSKAANETATLSIRSGFERLYVDQVTPNREIVMMVAMGITHPLHAGSSSKAFLAWLPPSEIVQFLRRKLKPITPQTIIDPQKIMNEIRLIRNRGYSQSVGERQSGSASVAAPIFDRSGAPIAVISVCGPSDRFKSELPQCVPLLLESAARLSKRMGYIVKKGT